MKKLKSSDSTAGRYVNPCLSLFWGSLNRIVSWRMYCILRLSSSVSELIKSSSKIFVTRQMTFLLFSFILDSFQFNVHGSSIIPVIPWYKIESDIDGVRTQTEKPSWASPTMRSTFSVTVAIWRSARNNSSWSSWETLYHLKKCYYWIRFELGEHEHGSELRLKWPTMVHGLLAIFRYKVTAIGRSLRLEGKIRLKVHDQRRTSHNRKWRVQNS